MNIQNFSSISAGNEYLSNQFQDFSSRPVSENSNNSASRIDIEKNQQREDGDTLAITKESSIAAKRLEVPRETVSKLNYGTDFSTRSMNIMTTNGDESALSNVQSNDDILNQYRFFVQSFQYQDADGAVKRIFR